MAERSGPGVGTLQHQLWESHVERLKDRIADVQEDHQRTVNQVKTCFEKIEKLEDRLNSSQNATSARNLSMSAGGGVGIVGLVEAIRWLVDSGILS